MVICSSSLLLPLLLWFHFSLPLTLHQPTGLAVLTFYFTLGSLNYLVPLSGKLSHQTTKWPSPSSWFFSMRLIMIILFEIWTYSILCTPDFLYLPFFFFTFLALFSPQNLSILTFISLLYLFKVLRRTVFTTCILPLGCNFLISCLFCSVS